MKTSFKPNFDMLEDRLTPASVVVAESTFDPQAFGDNIHSSLDFNVVGYAYAVNQNGAAVANEGTGGLYGTDLGLARTSANSDMTNFTTDTRIEVASVSKIITTVAVLNVLENQTDDLDAILSTPISEFLPADWTLGANVDLLTVRHLLTHTSGFGEGGPGDATNAIGVNFEVFANNNFQNLRNLVASDIGIPTVTLPDGSAAFPYSYSNANFALLAKMIPYMRQDVSADFLDSISQDYPALADSVFGAYYSQFVADNILSPAGIANPTMNVTGANPALGYDFGTAESVGGVSQSNLTNVGGAFGWKLSAPELAQFMNALRHGNTLLSDSARDLMTNSEFLLGWGPGDIDGTNPYILAPLQDEFGAYYQHGGSMSGATGGFRSQIVMFPGDIEAALVVNSTTNNFAFLGGHFSTMKSAYRNAWSSLVIEGSSGNNDFELRLNADDASKIDIIVDGDVISSPSVNVLHSLQFRGLGGDDTFHIEDLPSATDLILDGGDGHDTFFVGNDSGSTFDTILGNLTILGGGDDDSIEIDDYNGIGSDYAITGIDSMDIAYHGVITASGYAPDKAFYYGGIEDLVLWANIDPNDITVSGIANPMTIAIHAGDNADSILIANVAPGVAVNVYGGFGDDTVTIGKHDLGTVRGSVFFEGGLGADLLVLDDANAPAPAGRSYLFTTGTVTATGGFGGATYSNLVEDVRLEGSGGKDFVNVETLGSETDLDLYGHKGDDTFYIAATSKNVDQVDGDVVIHGGDGYGTNHQPNMAAPEDDDRVYVYDDKNGVANTSFTINLNAGSPLHGRLNKLANPSDHAPNVIYDQIERTFLYTNAGASTISVLAVPRFNQLSVYAGAGNDKIDIESTPIGGPMQIFGEGGEDAIRISPAAQSLGNLLSPVSIQGGSGAATERDHLSVYDALSGNGAPYDLSNTNLTRGGSAGVSYATIEDLLISLSGAANTMNISSTAAGTTVGIQGNGGNDTLIAANLASAVTFAGGAGTDDRVRLVGTNGNDIFSATGETMTLGAGTLSSQVERREIDGLAGNDRLSLAGIAGTNETFVLLPSSTPFAGRVNPNPFTPIFYERVEEMDAQGNGGDLDALQINGQTDPSAIGGGVYHDRFDINLAAAGTSLDPFLVLRNTDGQSLLTLTDYNRVGTPKINGLLGADAFDVRTSSAGLVSRGVQIDGGGEPLGLKGDVLRVYYNGKEADADWVPSSPKNGKIDIDYMALAFAIDYLNMEATQVLVS